MKSSFFSGSSRLPLVVEPSSSTSLSTLLGEVTSERAWLEAQLLEYGAILFRGYDICLPEDFQLIVQNFVEEFGAYTRGVSPRSRVSDMVYTSTDAPRFAPIPLHCELSYTPSPPSRILFFCQMPAQRGGETPIADMRKVYLSLDEAIIQRFEYNELRLIQNVPAKKLLGLGRTWQEMFMTDDRSEVERACDLMQIDCKWKPDNSLQLINHRPACLSHPVTGDRVLFTSFYNFHDSWSDEFKIHNQLWLSGLLGIGEMFRSFSALPAEDYPHHCTFADGAEIPRQDILAIRKVLRDHAVLFPWRQGDIIVIDNLRVSHGRMPYKGKRKILTAMGSHGRSI